MMFPLEVHCEWLDTRHDTQHSLSSCVASIVLRGVKVIHWKKSSDEQCKPGPASGDSALKSTTGAGAAPGARSPGAEGAFSFFSPGFTDALA